MITRWIKRACLGLLALGLVLVPTQMAHGPSNSQPMDFGNASPSAPFQRFSPVAATVVCLIGLATVALWRRRQNTYKETSL